MLLAVGLVRQTNADLAGVTLAAYTVLEAPEARRTLTWILAAQTVGTGRSHDVTGYSTEQIMNDVLVQIERWRQR